MESEPSPVDVVPAACVAVAAVTWPPAAAASSRVMGRGGPPWAEAWMPPWWGQPAGGPLG